MWLPCLVGAVCTVRGCSRDMSHCKELLWIRMPCEARYLPLLRGSFPKHFSIILLVGTCFSCPNNPPLTINKAIKLWVGIECNFKITVSQHLGTEDTGETLRILNIP